MQRATQASAESRAQTLAALNQIAGARESDISKRPIATWTSDETRRALESIGVTAYQMRGLAERKVLDGASLMLYMAHGRSHSPYAQPFK